MTDIDIPRTLRKLASLRKISKRQEGTPEGTNAQGILLSKMAASDLVLDLQDLDPCERLIEVENEGESSLLGAIALSNDIEAATINGKVRLKGAKVSVGLLVKSFEHHREKLFELQTLAFLGYFLGVVGQEGLTKLVEGGSSSMSDEPCDKLKEEGSGKIEEPSKFDTKIREIMGNLGQRSLRSVTVATGAYGAENRIDMWETIKKSSESCSKGVKDDD